MTLLEDITRQYCIDYLKNTIYYIHMKYPTKFAKSDAIKYIKLLETNITITESDNNVLINLANKKIEKRKSRNMGTYSLNNDIETPNNETRCISRIWANGKIQKTKDGVIFGDRCSRKRQTDKYCFQHNANNPHGDWNTASTSDLIKNYKTNSKIYSQIL